MSGIDTTVHQQLQWALTFAAVVEHGSFTAAARALGVSTALASRQVGQLEALLGTPLLYRTTRRLNLTEAGQVYLAHCREWPQRVGAASLAVRELRDEVAGKVRMTVPTSFGGVFMAQALLALRRQHPQLRVELDLGRDPRDLEADGYDLAIRSNVDSPDRLVSRPLSLVRDWLVASPAMFGGKPPVSPAELGDWPCLANHFFRDATHWAFSRGETLHTVDIVPLLQANDYGLLRNLALAGGGIARLPSYLAAADVDAGRLLRLLPDYRLPAMPFYLVYPQRLPQPAKVRALIDFLLDWFARPEQAVLLGRPGTDGREA
ncbi:LysR family transcriptional regulator [Jeongeupia chitinilytica]|uniref:Transcriptional regulator n=1 Tax=Jeongeupia chitinilytica TaxID=1041641 RepID=A0ABQ3H128_9NEIS|nr:LysR family transcriptional regulator [Jeongeupia chitinilytica]GHD62140.1 transcriptional regulator [Jeongeupia chitinilytica]